MSTTVKTKILTDILTRRRMQNSVPYNYFTGITSENKIAVCNLLDKDVDVKYIEANNYVLIANCDMKIKEDMTFMNIYGIYTDTPR